MVTHAINRTPSPESRRWFAASPVSEAYWRRPATRLLSVASDLQKLPRPLDQGANVLPPYTPLVLIRSFTRYARSIGLHGLTFHDLRHDAASTLTMAGVSQRAIMEILGNRDPRMTIRYQYRAPGHLQEAIQALDHAQPRGKGVFSEAVVSL